MVFVGNTDHTVPYMLKHTDLFDPLPEKFHDSAFLDRLHSYIPGWEVDVIRGEMFSTGYGFVVDYLAEILRSLRSHDFSDRYKGLFTLSDDISTRDRDGINKTFSGLMKILFPHGEATESEVEDVLRCAIEGRKRVKEQLLRIDTTYPAVRFTYKGTDGVEADLHPGGERVPNQYHRRVASEVSELDLFDLANAASKDTESDTVCPQPVQSVVSVSKEPELKPQHLVVQENQRGVTFDKLFWTLLKRGQADHRYRSVPADVPSVA